MFRADEPLLRLLAKYGFEPDETRTRWRFEGHPSRGYSLDLTIVGSGDSVVYRMSIQSFPGGLGYEEDLSFTAAERPRLERMIEDECEEARRPYIKTRLQRLFEPWIGHDAAWALFHRRPKKR